MIFRSAGQLLKKAEELGIDLPWQNSIAPLLSPFSIVEKKVPNRITVQPMEGCDGTPEGAPDELTFRRYRRYALGGNGLIWFEACSVSAAGRSNPRQLLLTSATLGGFKRLVEAARTAARDRFGSSWSPYLVLQLTHCGRFSKASRRSKPKAAYFNPYWDQSPHDVELYRDEELQVIRDRFVAAALLAQRAGFDAVDIKACHGYLLNELLSAFTRTDSSYGGSFECRTRLLLEIVRQISESASGLAVAVRLNATDAIPFGFGVERNGTATPDLSEPLRLQLLLKEAGCALLNISAGVPSRTPQVSRPFNRPARGTEPSGIHPLVGVNSLIQWAAAFQKAQVTLPVVGSGYSSLNCFWPYVGAAVVAGGGASFIGLGRSSFAYPDAAFDLMTNEKLNSAKCCVACSSCAELLKNNQVAGCVIRDPALYKKAYRKVT